MAKAHTRAGFNPATPGYQPLFVAGDGPVPETQPQVGVPQHIRGAGQPLSMPVQVEGQLLGILFLGHRDEPPPSISAETRAAITRHVQAAISLAQGGQAMRVHYFRANSSVFIDGCYLIKGVAGAVLWQILGDHAANGRLEFSNRELRLVAALKLPETSHNLEVRLRLLQHRLEEHGQDLRIERVARGKYRLAIARPIELLAS